MIYLAIDISRPVLGFQFNLSDKKFTRDGTQIPGDAVVLRIVGKAAREAVNKEFQISTDLSAAVQNNIFTTYLISKMPQIVALGIAVLLVYTNLWSEIFVWIVGAFSA